MSDPREYLDEYLDGLLDDDARRAVEDALEQDAGLRAELKHARGFERMLADLPAQQAVTRAVAQVRRRGRTRRLAVVASVAAALIAGFLLAPRGPAPGPTHEEETLLAWVDFGQRLGKITRERRAGRVPRTGIGGLRVPPAEGYGIVFRGALEALNVRLAPELKKRVQDIVRDHFIGLRGLSDDAAGESRRAESALALYRDLRALAGSETADAYYDVFRPTLATPANVAHGLPPFLRAQYEQEYQRALAQLQSRYGQRNISLVLERLAGSDRRFLFRDASQDGVGRDAVLAIRARLYRAAREAGVDKLYLAQS